MKISSKWRYFRFNVSQLASCPTCRIAGSACAGNVGTFSPPPRVSDPDMHHGTCVTRVPWCMPGSLTSSFVWNRWRGKRSRHYRCMRNQQFHVPGKRPMGYDTIAGSNLALNKPGYASATYMTSNTTTDPTIEIESMVYATDGDLLTRARTSPNGQNSWIIIELLQTFFIQHLVLYRVNLSDSGKIHVVKYYLFCRCMTSLCYIVELTHLPLDEMAAISQTTFSNAFSSMKKMVFGF